MLQNYAKGVLLGKASETLNRPPTHKNDPEIRAAVEAAAASTSRHWWSRQPKPDIILNERDRAVLKAVKSRAWVLDEGFHCCCFRVGLDPIIGLIPGVGDAIGLGLALELVRVALRADLPKHIVMQMLINVGVDFAAGLVPVLGDIADALIKCNKRNADILEEYLMLRRRDEIRAERLAEHNIGSPSHHSNNHSHHDKKTNLPPAIADKKNASSPSAPAPAVLTQHGEHETQSDTQKKNKYGTFFDRFRS